MHDTKKMRAFIERLAGDYRFDLQRADGSELVVTNPPYERLHVIAYTKNVVRVAHIYYQQGDAMYDPDIAFHTNVLDGFGWLPLSYELSSLGIYQTCAEWGRDGISKVDLAQQKKLATFANLWAINLKKQGFLHPAGPEGRVEVYGDGPVEVRLRTIGVGAGARIEGDPQRV
jgi:hypothetical protein